MAPPVNFLAAGRCTLACIATLSVAALSASNFRSMSAVSRTIVPMGESEHVKWLEDRNDGRLAPSRPVAALVASYDRLLRNRLHSAANQI